MKQAKKLTMITMMFAGLSLLSWQPGLLAGAGDSAADQQARLEHLKAHAREASLSFLPVSLNGHPIAKVGEVVGVLMERAGMNDLEICETEFKPPEGADFDGIIAALGSFVKEQKIATDYVFYGAFLGLGQESGREIQGMIVDREGHPVWRLRQTPEDEAWGESNPQDPMSCSIFVAQQLQMTLELDDPLREDAPEGKLAKRLNRESGIPEQAELDAMEKRLEKLKAADRPVALTVYPVKMIDGVDQTAAANLARGINKSGFFKAVADAKEVPVEEKKLSGMPAVLWHLARSFQAYLKNNSPETDYGLFVHCVYFPPEEPELRGVYGVICDRDGNYAWVTIANSHHEDFQKLDVRSPEACTRLTAGRLEEIWK